jgi:hypothetical protein
MTLGVVANFTRHGAVLCHGLRTIVVYP